MIYKELSEHDFAYELSNNKDNWFSYEGAKALFNYLEEMSDDIEFDAVALRCEYSEYTQEELINNYSHLVDREEEQDDDEYFEELRDYIENNTTLLTIDDDSYIIADF